VEPGAFTIEVAVAELRRSLPHANDDCLEMLEYLLTAKPPVHSVRAFGAAVSLHPGTLMSRFLRANLPPLKQYLDYANLVRAALALEDTSRSIADIAVSLDYSSPQSFGRHVHRVMGVSAAKFRAQFDGEGMFRSFLDTLVLPCSEQLSTFRPLRDLTGETEA
jgi:transcriptional regulator GlxA family with amidase domain